MRTGSTNECSFAQRVGDHRFLIRAWPDGCVVFDRLSGDTHALDPLTARVFVFSIEAGVAELPHGIRQHFPALTENECEEAVTRARSCLADLGLLARSSSRE